MSFTTLRPVIKTKLDGIDELAYVNDFHTMETDGYPMATFEPSGHENSMISDSDNFRAHTFDIIVQQEMENIGRDEAVRILAAAVDAIITAFDEDLTLGGATQWCTPIPSAWGTTNVEGAVMYATMQLVCNSEVTVDP